MKKKILAFGLLCAMGLSVLTGCGSTNPTPENTPSPAETNQEAASPEEGQKTDEGAETAATDIGYTKLIVGLDDTFAPMGFRDENNELVGFDVELAKAVGEEIGVEIEFQPIDWSMKETELNNKKIDLLWNGYSITEERKEKVLFTQPYLDNRMVVVTMAESEIKSLADLSGKSVAVQSESSALNAIDSKPEIRDSFGEMPQFETNNECLMDMEAGRTDAVVADEVLLRYYLSEKGPEKYKILEEDFGSEQYGIGARKEDAALVEAINSALDTLKENGKGKEISEKWFAEDILK